MIVVIFIMLKIKVFINVDRVFWEVLFEIIIVKECGVVVLLVEVYVEIMEVIENVVMIIIFVVIIDNKVLIDFWVIFGIYFFMFVLLVSLVIKIMSIDIK